MSSETKTRRRTGPSPSLWIEGGGMVTRCDDPAIARPLLVEAYTEDNYLDAADPDEAAELTRLFPLDKAAVQRGRVVPCNPDMSDGYSWIWRPLPADAKGPGVTTAVVWADNR